MSKVTASKGRIMLASLADELGKIQARKAELEEAEKLLKARLVESGIDRADGQLFTALVIRSEYAQVNYRNLVERLDPPTKLLKMFTEHKERVQVRVTARTTE